MWPQHNISEHEMLSCCINQRSSHIVSSIFFMHPYLPHAKGGFKWSYFQAFTWYLLSLFWRRRMWVWQHSNLFNRIWVYTRCIIFFWLSTYKTFTLKSISVIILLCVDWNVSSRNCWGQDDQILWLNLFIKGLMRIHEQMENREITEIIRGWFLTGQGRGAWTVRVID